MYSEIIRDTIKVFRLLPVLFYTRLDSAYPGRNNVAEYEMFMEDCIAKVRRGLSLSPIEYQAFWGEDGHILAVALLYDVCVYVYNGSIWQAYNSSGQRYGMQTFNYYNNKRCFLKGAIVCL